MRMLERKPGGKAADLAERAAQAAYEARPCHIAGPIPLNALVSFGELVDAARYERGHSGAVETYTLRASASGLQVTRIVHSIGGYATTVELGDPIPTTEELLARIAARVTQS